MSTALQPAPQSGFAAPSLDSLGREIACRKSARDSLFNEVFARMKTLPPFKQPLVHRFTRDENGKVNAYLREILNPKGSCIMTKIHKTEHFFVVLSGRMKVRSPGDKDWTYLSSGQVGVTQPGTRRIIVALTDVRFLTFHPTDTDDLGAIEAQIIHPHDVGPARLEDLAEMRKIA